MFGRYAQPMTEWSGHFLDWSRTGELLLSATHRYSFSELAARGFIVATIATSMYVGATKNDPEQTNVSSFTMSVIAGLAGFVSSHVIVILPLVYKRYCMSRECSELIKEINQLLVDKGSDYADDCLADVNQLLSYISTLSLSNEQHANASMTWGRRRTLLALVVEKLQQDVSADFWNKKPEELVRVLTNSPTDVLTQTMRPG